MGQILGGNLYYFVIVAVIIAMLFIYKNAVISMYYSIFGTFRMKKNAKTTPEQYRQLLVGAIYAKQQGAYMNILKTGMSPNKAMTLANQWWGINNHTEAMNTLDYLLEDGFNTLFPHVYNAFLLEDDEERKNYLISVIAPDKQVSAKEEEEIKNKLNKAYSQVCNLVESYDKLVEHKIIANKEDLMKYGSIGWDAGRLSFLARVCYNLHYLSEAEAWRFVEKAYLQSKNAFTNWEDFGKSYVIGRTLWGGFDSTNSVIISHTEDLLNLDKKGPWTEVKW